MALLAACSTGGDDGSPESRERVRLVITGSSTVAPLVSEIAERFEAEHPEVRIDVQTGGSSRGMSDARRGLAEIGMVSRSPKSGEEDLEWHPLARDGLALIVHADNPVRSLARGQVEAIYRGEIGDWSEVGGRAAPITVVSKAEGRSTLEVFLEYLGAQASALRASVIIGDNQQGIKTVVGNPDAIAYVSIGTAEFEVERGTPIRLLELDGLAASSQAVREGSYPIARTLNLVTAGQPAGQAAEFIAYCRSSAVHDLVEGQYFVALEE